MKEAIKLNEENPSIETVKAITINVDFKIKPRLRNKWKISACLSILSHYFCYFFRRCFRQIFKDDVDVKARRESKFNDA